MPAGLTGNYASKRTNPMNCIELASRHAREVPDRLAIWMPGSKKSRSYTYNDLFAEACTIQSYVAARGIGHGHRVLLAMPLSPRLYATVLALVGLGASVMLVEPWMPLDRLRNVLKASPPDAFIANWMGKLWGARVRAIRKIPIWLSPSSSPKRGSHSSFITADVPGETPAILTFTSGTTGHPKGVVRTHQFLTDQHRVLVNALAWGIHKGPDLCIFANFTLANLASGRTTLLMPSSWHPAHLRQVDQLPASLQPETMTCGPAFLQHAMLHGHLKHLQSIHVGGALTDCETFEHGFTRWPDAEWTHVYGSTEAEPVSLCDAREAVSRSRQEGYIQTLYVGTPINEIRHDTRQDALWVTGPHVCPRYLGNEAANQQHKRLDAHGDTWHCMGDRIQEKGSGFWYSGRSHQPLDDFLLEQRLYARLGTSDCFIHRTPNGKRCLIGNVSDISLPEVDEVITTPVYRDRRHRARIDRTRTINRVKS